MISASHFILDSKLTFLSLTQMCRGKDSQAIMNQKTRKCKKKLKSKSISILHAKCVL